MNKAQALALKPGSTVKVYQKLKEVDDKGKEKERLQIFEGMIIARHGRKDITSTFTVRKESHGVGVEKIFPVFSPNIDKVEITGTSEVHRAKLHFLRKPAARKLKETS